MYRRVILLLIAALSVAPLQAQPWLPPYLAGSTFSESQHSGSVGRMIGVDAAGLVHLVWTKNLTPNLTGPRHVYYNLWSPLTQEFTLGGGNQVNSGSRAGYVSVATLPGNQNGGWVFPVYHAAAVNDAARPHTAAAIDYLPGTGAFTQSMVPFLRHGGVNLQLVWPKAALGPDSVLHVVSTESPEAADPTIPLRIFYSRGIPDWDTHGQGAGIEWQVVAQRNGEDVYFREIDATRTMAANIAASAVSDRVVIGYVRPPRLERDADEMYNGDLWLCISEDGGLNWAAPQNITQFAPPDTLCPDRDSVRCNRDTLRAGHDCSLLFDGRDYLHAAFSTGGYFWHAAGAPSPLVPIGQSMIWHWSDEYGEFSPIARAWDRLYTTDSLLIDPGPRQLYADRPCLAQNPQTGYLYCAYRRCMPDQWLDPAEFGARPKGQGDIFISASCNNGRVWSTGRNITRTNGGQNPVPGSAANEVDPSLAELVSDGLLHLTYMRDVAGLTEGIENLVWYHPLRVDSTLLRPLVDPFSRPLRYDSTGYTTLTPADTMGDNLCSPQSTRRTAFAPTGFLLHQNYPNPFNPATVIRFELTQAMRVSLVVYNLLGEEVAVLAREQWLPAGSHEQTFDASRLASGLYFYRLAAGDQTALKKMILLR